MAVVIFFISLHPIIFLHLGLEQISNNKRTIDIKLLCFLTWGQILAFSSHWVSFNNKSENLPKITEFHNSSLSQEYVLWFHVSVKYPVRVQIVQCLDKLACYHADLKIQMVTIQYSSKIIILLFPAMEIIITNVQAVTQFDSGPLTSGSSRKLEFAA